MGELLIKRKAPLEKMGFLFHKLNVVQNFPGNLDTEKKKNLKPGK